MKLKTQEKIQNQGRHNDWDNFLTTNATHGRFHHDFNLLFDISRLSDEQNVLDF